ncbi:MAG: alpha/beta hydrolase [Parvularculaceae bacterium]|nr:alpha/beta hydrolase [Parvularculaceae bacterium]
MMTARLVVAFAAAAMLGGCTQLTLSWADLEPEGAPATPPALAAFDDQPEVATPVDWAARRPLLQRALERHVYGVMPEASATRVVSRRVVNANAYGGRGVLEEYVIAASATFGGVSVAVTSELAPDGFLMSVATPKDAKGPVPVILMETFCPRWSTLPDPGVTRPEGAEDRKGFALSVETYVFGQYICTPPVEEIVARGYAIATIFPSEFAPDRRLEGLAELRRLSAGYADETTRWGAIAAWAFAYSRMVDALETDPRYAAMIAFGHSRYAKSALLAAAFDARIDGVVAHQSGTGGASLNRDKPGESVASITATYPHWFARAYAAHAGREGDMPVDQHHLLALIAPRPVLLGNARRDVWSDPNGAFRAAQGADPVYELLGARGLTVERLDAFDPEAELAFWIRPGTHGVVKEDWPAFLRFLDAHFKG